MMTNTMMTYATDDSNSASAPDYECRRCLSSEMSDKQYYDTIRDYVASLPDDIKTAPVEYGRRLAVCQTCDNLINGMCKLCGCFVEARAARINSHCAKDSRIW